ncbi:MAG: SpoIIE family protein phosphatase [SAR324 cluster bacterium]|nr:SpoIIE family protein phosphatase [SAR324 cluster bacterium]
MNHLFKSVQQDTQLQTQLIDQDNELLIRILKAIPVIAVLTVLAIFLFIRRSVLRRILALEVSMRSYVEGIPLPLPIEGSDEITSMAQSVEHFVTTQRQSEQKLFAQKNQLEALNHELERGLQLASEIQNSTMRFQKNTKFLKSALLFYPYSKVSGDFYDEYQGKDGSFDIFLGDATGHGMSAALISMMVKMGLIDIADKLTPVEIIRALDHRLSQCIPPETFETGIYLKISPDGLLTFSNAGHPPLLIIPSKTQKAVILDQKGMAMGMFEEELITFVEHSYALTPGDKFYIYTDGITECNSGSEQFGLDQLVHFLEQHNALEVEEIIKSLSETLKDFTHPHGFQDDVTLLGFEYLGNL